MAIPMPIPGFSKYVDGIPEGSLICIIGGEDPAKSALVSSIVESASSEGWPVTYIATRWLEEVKQSIKINPNWAKVEVIYHKSCPELSSALTGKRLLVVDSFSFMFLGSEVADIGQVLESLREACRLGGGSVLLVSEENMFSGLHNAVISHLTDCIIHFINRESPDGMNRYIRIPKWVNGLSVMENIHYDFSGGEIKLDLRARVV